MNDNERAKREALEGEPIRTYFDAPLANRPVLRYELQAVLVQYHRARVSERVTVRVRAFFRTVWIWLNRPSGSGPVKVNQFHDPVEEKK